MSEPSFGAGFAQVDAAAEPRALIEYLDSVSSIDAVQAAKAESLDLLGLSKGCRAVDVGCGPGDDVLAMAQRVGTSGHATGIDSSVAVIEEARRRAPAELPVTFLVADAAALPFEDGSVGAVRADRTFQHVDAPETAMAEMARVCAPGGVIVVSEFQYELLVDGAPPRDAVAQAIRDRFWSQTERRSWLGFMLPVLMHRVGLKASVTQRTGQTTDFGEIDALAHLRALADRLADDGVVKRADATRWLDDLQQRATEGGVSLRMRFFHFAGRLPAS